jgi:penicillin-binding protein 2
MDPFQNRRWVIIITIFFIGIIFTVRLLYLQVFDSKWKERAAEITHAEKVLNPSRGLIYDRKGNIIVEASPVYDLFLIPNKLQEQDSAFICTLLDLSASQFSSKRIQADSTMRWAAPPAFISGISKTDYQKIAYDLDQVPAIYAKRNSQRAYPRHIAAHVLGYISAIDEKQYYQTKKEGDDYYFATDYIGITGIEKIYEKQLRGQRGRKTYLKDRLGAEKENLGEVSAVSGSNLYSTLDADLQAYGELLMGNKIGSIVAIEPKTGEILTMISAPFYDPELLVGRDKGKNYEALQHRDTVTKDLFFNKAIKNDSYRPGSIFKLVQALIAMQEGIITKNTGFVCNKSMIGCHNHEAPTNIEIAIKHSCNPYFYQVYKRLIQRGEDKGSIFRDSRLGIEKWAEAMRSFGLGGTLDTDLPGVRPGLVPDGDFYDNKIKRGNDLYGYGKYSWAFSTIYSNSIGEGEVGVSPLQMANIAAIIANKGYYYTPHLIKSIGENGTKKEKYLKKNYTMVDPSHFTPVINAMEMVVESGTARRAQIDSIAVCGKTGTVQNVAENINDHSVFIAFAPKDDPKIAIAVYVEYGTWGGKWAAPIASLMIEKYLNGVLSEKGMKKEEIVIQTSILQKNQVFK